MEYLPLYHLQLSKLGVMPTEPTSHFAIDKVQLVVLVKKKGALLPTRGVGQLGEEKEQAGNKGQKWQMGNIHFKKAITRPIYAVVLADITIKFAMIMKISYK